MTAEPREAKARRRRGALQPPRDTTTKSRFGGFSDHFNQSLPIRRSAARARDEARHLVAREVRVLALEDGRLRRRPSGLRRPGPAGASHAARRNLSAGDVGLDVLLGGVGVDGEPAFLQFRSGTSTTVSDMPVATFSSGYSGAGLRSHVPSWMCTGCGTSDLPTKAVVEPARLRRPTRAFERRLVSAHAQPSRHARTERPHVHVEECASIGPDLSAVEYEEPPRGRLLVRHLVISPATAS